MEDRSFRPWLVTLLVSIGCAVALIIFTNLSGGYANISWFVSLGIGVGVTLACFWLYAGRLVRWRWVEADTPTVERRLAGDDVLRGHLTALSADRPGQLGQTVRPVLAAVAADRLRRHHAVGLDTEPERARTVVGADLFAVITTDAPLSAAQLPRLIDQLDALLPQPLTDRPPTEGNP